MKMSPVGADLFHADGRIDMTKLLFTFRNLRTPLKTERSAHTVYLCILNGSENKQQLFSCTVLISCNL